MDDDLGDVRMSSVIRVRWELVLLLFAVGLGLCVAAFVVDGDGWDGLGPTALLQVGITIGLVGVLLIVERSLLQEIRSLRDVVTINCYVRKQGEGADAWNTSTDARPEDELEFLIRFENAGSRTLRNVVIGNNLPKYVRYVKGSTELRNGAHPSGVSINSDSIVQGGINVGNYCPGAVGYVCFTARTDSIAAYEQIGTYDLRNVGVVRPQGLNEHYDVARVLLEVSGEESGSDSSSNRVRGLAGDE